jgi:hypothetical protein
MEQSPFLKLIIPLIPKKFPTFMAPEDPLSCSKEPVTDSCHEPDESSLHLSTLFILN